MSDLIPRLTREKLHPDLQAYLRPRIERLGYLGEFFQCAGHQPEALLSFLEYTDHLKHALPNNLTEIVSLTVAQIMNNSYERVQHERLSLKIGLGEDWLREVLTLKADGQGNMSEQEVLVQRLTMSAINRRGHDITQELEPVVHSIGPAMSIAVLMLVGRYLSHAIIANALNLAPPVPSPLAVETNG
jgi:alkylhydroperoxidase family enzyme